MSTVDVSNNPQINHDHSDTGNETSEKKIERLADEMASKAGKVEKHFESSDTVGGVRSNSGGIFTK